jgi:hypothetical protein
MQIIPYSSKVLFCDQSRLTYMGLEWPAMEYENGEPIKMGKHQVTAEVLKQDQLW